MSVNVQQLRMEKARKQSSLNTYVRRRDALQAIIKRIDGEIDDDIRDINWQISKCTAELQQGLKGGGKVAQICSDMELEKEKTAGVDTQISFCRSVLATEVIRCQGQIDTLTAEVSTLNQKILTEMITTIPSGSDLLL